LWAQIKHLLGSFAAAVVCPKEAEVEELLRTEVDGLYDIPAFDAFSVVALPVSTAPVLRDPVHANPLMERPSALRTAFSIHNYAFLFQTFLCPALFSTTFFEVKQRKHR